jgi:MoaA/NifB/PqqE/SkfB family radical SAM enzyme
MFKMFRQTEVSAMINEQIVEITSGARSLAEKVGYVYAEAAKKHRYKYLFEPMRLNFHDTFIKQYVQEGNPFPISVEIDPSNACNHDCSFCIYHSMHTKERSEKLPAKVMKRLINELVTNGCKSILFVGGGEPMTNPATVDAIELAASHNISVGLVTNGALVGKNHAKRLKQAASYVRFSLDAAKPGTHFKLHRIDDHKRIIES